jgi:anaerobic selenocysteine-containing dehydrogenase
MAQERASVCPLDCPDTCSLTVTVDRDRIVRVRGSHANPFTAGVICAKVARHYPEFVHGEERLRTPLARRGPRGSGRFERVTWDAALDEIASRMRAQIARHGGATVMPLNYAGPHGMLAGGSMDQRFFHRLGATRLDRSPLCGGIRREAWIGTYGTVPGMNPEQLAEAKLILVWGNNVTVSNLHVVPLVNAARRAGAKVVVIDPRRTKIAEQADRHLALRPGTDVVLAFALARELERLGGIDHRFLAQHAIGAEEFLDRARERSLEDAARACGLEPARITELATWYRDLSPAAISVGNGLERNQNGGSGLRAIFALPALAGKLGVRGGGVVHGASFAFPKTPARLQRPDLAPAGTRVFNIIDVAAHLLDPALAPPITVVFIYNHNPLIVHPDQNRLRRALAREDLFVIGCDVTLTDSLRYADIVLPAQTHFEHPDIFAAYGQHWLQRAEPVIPPVGEALSNMEIFRRLAARLGFDDPIFRASDEELMDDALDLGGARARDLPLDRAIPMKVDGTDPILCGNVFPRTPSGKIELRSQHLERAYGQPLPDYRPLAPGLPLILLTPASDERITSTFGGVDPSTDPPALEMHPDDARARGLTEGAPVRAFNELGEVHLTLKISDRVRPGVVSSFKGAWLKTSPNGQTVSALAPASHADLARGACFNDARVQVAALAERHGAATA